MVTECTFHCESHFLLSLVVSSGDRNVGGKRYRKLIQLIFLGTFLEKLEPQTPPSNKQYGSMFSARQDEWVGLKGLYVTRIVEQCIEERQHVLVLAL